MKWKLSQIHLLSITGGILFLCDESNSSGSCNISCVQLVARVCLMSFYCVFYPCHVKPGYVIGFLILSCIISNFRLVYTTSVTTVNCSSKSLFT